jgi:hypothetical protein
LGLVVPMKILVPAWTVLSLCGSLIILGRDHRHIAWDTLLQLLPGSMLGIVLRQSACSIAVHPSE